MGTVWIRVRREGGRTGRLTHAVDVDTGRLACGIGGIDPLAHSVAELRRMECDDARIRRCPLCARAVLRSEQARPADAFDPAEHLRRVIAPRSARDNAASVGA